MLLVLATSSCTNIDTNANAHAHTGVTGKRDSIHLLGAISETATVLEFRHKLLYTNPSGWYKIDIPSYSCHCEYEC